MTPAEHLAEAERLLSQASIPAGDSYVQLASPLVQQAIAHALIAAAAELGVPHDSTTTGGGPGGTPGTAG